jgi:hypothetical protein
LDWKTCCLDLANSSFSFWIKKAPLWSGQIKKLLSIMKSGQGVTFRASVMAGADKVSFPQRYQTPLSITAFSPLRGRGTCTKIQYERRDDFAKGAI